VHLGATLSNHLGLRLWQKLALNPLAAIATAMN